MKIETTLTERDKKLIAIVGPIVIVIVLAWAFIVPLWNAHGQLEQQAATTTTQVQEMSNPGAVDAIKADTKATEEANAKALKGFYPKQTDASITRLGTSLAKSHGLKVRNLTFALATGAADTTAYTAGGSGDGSGSDGSGSGSGSSASGDGIAAAPTGDATGIGENRLQLTVSGTRAKLQKFVNDCAGEYGGIRVQSFSWTQADVEEKGSTPWNLTILLSVYSLGV